MGLFKKKVSVTVHGYDSKSGGADGRYDKQAKRNRKTEKKKMKEIVFEPHTTAELRGYIEKKYDVSELTRTDERYKAAYMGVKAHLVETYAPERYESFEQAVMIPPAEFPVHLHVYNLYIHINDLPIAWLEVYVETDHEYLAFRTVPLEFEEHYSIDQAKADIIRYFGAGKEDKKKNNERYLQLVSIQ